METMLYGVILGSAIIYLLSVNRRLARSNIKLSNKLKKREKLIEYQIDARKQSNHTLRLGLDKGRFENARLQNEVNNLRHKNYMLTQEIISYKNSYSKQHLYNDDIVDAVKKAMIYSHPDKGNCSTSDDFIKYKKIYDRLKGENNNEK